MSALSNSLSRLQAARLQLRDLSPPGCIPDSVVTAREIDSRALSAAQARFPEERWRLCGETTPQAEQRLLDAITDFERSCWLREINCYAYAVNCLPGDPAGHDEAYNPGTWSLDRLHKDNHSRKGLIENCEHDGLIRIEALAPPEANLRGHYLVAAYLGLAPGRELTDESLAHDFHFLRREKDGKWMELSVALQRFGLTQVFESKFEAILKRETGFRADGTPTFTHYHLVSLFWCPNSGLPLANRSFLAKNLKYGTDPTEPYAELLTLPTRPLCTSSEEKC